MSTLLLLLLLVVFTVMIQATSDWHSLVFQGPGPSARNADVVWIHDTNVYVFGGGGTNELWKFNFSTQSWTGFIANSQLGNYSSGNGFDAGIWPRARSDSASCSRHDNGNLLVFSGLSYGGDVVMNDLWEFSLEMGKWKWVSGSKDGFNDNPASERGNWTMPWERFGAKCVIHGENLFLFGGSTLFGDLNDLWMLNLTSYQWVNYSYYSPGLNQTGNYGTLGVASNLFIPHPRSQFSFWTLDDSLFIFGGYSSFTQGYMNDFWIFDLILLTWKWVSGSSLSNQNLMNYPSSRSLSCFSSSGNSLYLSGGKSYMNINLDVWRFDVSSNSWAQVSNSEKSLYAHQCTYYEKDDLLLSFGGTVNQSTLSNDFLVFGEGIFKLGIQTCTGCDGLNCTKLDLLNRCFPCFPGYSGVNGSCQVCPSGKFTSSSSNSVCNFCDAGKYSINSSASTACLSCKSGKSNSIGQSCMNCTRGKYSSSQTPICSECLPGLFSDTEGVAQCKKCEIGKVSSNGQFSCSLCPQGKYTVDNINCISCQGFKYSLGGTSSCLNCSDGYTSNDLITCLPCKSGKFGKSGVCFNCMEGTFSSEGQRSCGCALGTYSPTNTTNGTCILCDMGKFSSIAGSSICQSCAPGSWSISGSSLCNSAPCVSTQCTNAFGISVAVLTVVTSGIIWCSGSGVGTMFLLLFSSFELWGNVTYLFVEPFMSPVIFILWIIVIVHGFLHPICYDVFDLQRTPSFLRYQKPLKYRVEKIYNSYIYVARILVLCFRYFHIVIPGLVMYPLKLVTVGFFRTGWYKYLLKRNLPESEEAMDRTILFRTVYFENIYLSLPLFVLQVIHLHLYQHRNAFTMAKILLSAFFTLRGIIYYAFWIKHQNLSWEELYPDGGRMNQKYVLKAMKQPAPIDDEKQITPNLSGVKMKKLKANPNVAIELRKLINTPLEKLEISKKTYSFPPRSFKVIDIEDTAPGEAEIPHEEGEVAIDRKRKQIAIISVHVPTPEEAQHAKDLKKKVEKAYGDQGFDAI